jgi:phosphonopyruvate decarboxylase
LLGTFVRTTDNAPAERHVITARGRRNHLAMGHYLGSGEIGLVYMQNSELGNTVNPLTSLADPAVYGVPMILMVGWRGRPGEHDEPQHVQMGKVTLETLRAIGVAASELPDELEAAKATLASAVADAKARRAVHALVVKKGTFGAYKLSKKSESPYALTREAAIAAVVHALPKGAAIVATTGMPSRELFEIREQRTELHDSDFLTVGGMGHASQIALGVALSQPARRVYCLDGDGAVLMHMGGLTTIGQLGLKNRHIVLNNGAHDGGGQPTVAFDVDLCADRESLWLRHRPPHGAMPRLVELEAADGPACSRCGEEGRPRHRRPTQSPSDLAVSFSTFVRG